MADVYVCPHGQTRPCDECDKGYLRSETTRLGQYLLRRQAAGLDYVGASVYETPIGCEHSAFLAGWDAAVEEVGLMLQTPGGDGRFCTHHEDDPAHGQDCYSLIEYLTEPTRAVDERAREKMEETQQWRKAATEFAVDVGRLRMAAQSALGFMEGIVHEDLASQKFVKDSARQQIQQLRAALYAAQRCGYCNDSIVRAAVGEGYVHVKSGLRTCVGRREDDPSPPSATPEW